MDSKLKLTATRLTRPAPINPFIKLSQDFAPGDSQTLDAHTLRERVNVIERSPLKREFNSKVELEETDSARLADYNMYWHLKEFDPIDINEEIDLDEKYKRKQKIEKMIAKFKEMPE